MLDAQELISRVYYRHFPFLTKQKHVLVYAAVVSFFIFLVQVIDHSLQFILAVQITTTWFLSFFQVPPTTVSIDPSLENSLAKLLDDLGLQPVLSPPKTASPDQPYNMITHYNLTDFEESPKQPPQLIAWCPPQPNWNPWTGCNIDEGIYVRFIRIRLLCGR